MSSPILEVPRPFGVSFSAGCFASAGPDFMKVVSRPLALLWMLVAQ